jgi:hypothetical protein
VEEVGFELSAGFLHRPRSERWIACDLGFSFAECDHSCPLGSAGFRCGADPTRTSSRLLTGVDALTRRSSAPRDWITVRTAHPWASTELTGEGVGVDPLAWL